jgi:WD40 repeat protein
MSPEQLTAQRIPLDRRTDVYSLGATLYEALTLQKPFAAPTRAELYQRILIGDPSSASSLNRQVSHDLEVVLETAMEKDRNRRYQTAHDLAEDLRRVRMLEAIRARPMGRLLRLRRWAQRHPVLAVGATGVLAAFALTLAMLLSVRAEQRRTSALLHMAEAIDVAGSDPIDAVALARHATALATTPETLGTLNRVLAAYRKSIVLRHQGPVNTICFSPDGTSVVTAADDGLARIWSLEGRLEHGLDHQGVQVNSAELSPDGQRVVTACRDGSWHLWSSQTGKSLGTFRAAEDTSLSVAMFLDNAHVATAAGPGYQKPPSGSRWALRVWSLDGRQTIDPMLYQSPIDAMAVVPGRREVLTVSMLERVRRCDTTSGRCNGLPWHEDPGCRFWSIAVAPDGGQILLGGEDRFARLLHQQGQQLDLFRGHGGFVNAVGFSPPNVDHTRGRVDTLARGRFVLRRLDWLLTASSDGIVRLFDRTRGEVLRLAGHRARVRDAGFSPDGSTIASCSEDQTARIWQIASDAFPAMQHEGIVLTADWSPDGERILTGGTDGCWRLSDSRGQPVVSMRCGRRVLARFVSGNRILALEWAAVGSPGISLWTPEGMHLASVSPPAAGGAPRLEIAAHGKTAVTAWDDGTTALVELDPLSLRVISKGNAAAPMPADAAPCINFTADGRELLFGIGDARDFTAPGRIERWSLDGQQRTAIATTPSFPTRVAQVPDRDMLIVGHLDGSIALLDLESGTSRLLGQHDKMVLGVAFGRDGKRFATSDIAGTARIWDAGTGGLLQVITAHDSWVLAAALSPDGKRLLTASADNTARVWIADEQVLLATADAILAENKPH